MNKIFILLLVSFNLNGCYHIGYAGGIITNKAIYSIVDYTPINQNEIYSNNNKCNV